MDELKQSTAEPGQGPDFAKAWANEPEPSNLPKMIGIAAVLVSAIVAAVFFLSPEPEAARPAVAHPYSEQITFSDIKMNEVENFAGGNVTYIEGRITNGGDKTVTAATVESTFRNALGEVVQTDKQALKVFGDVGLYEDAVDVRNAPLKPKETRVFRLAYDRVSADWNQGYPELHVSSVSVQ
jgi:hypothetical protein